MNEDEIYNILHPRSNHTFPSPFSSPTFDFRSLADFIVLSTLFTFFPPFLTLVFHPYSNTSATFSFEISSDLGPRHTCQKKRNVTRPAMARTPRTTTSNILPCTSLFWMQNAAMAREKLSTAYRSDTSGMERKHAVMARSESRPSSRG